MAVIGWQWTQKSRKPFQAAALVVFCGPWWTLSWWSRGELNPRPSVRCLVLYMLRFRQLI